MPYLIDKVHDFFKSCLFHFHEHPSFFLIIALRQRIYKYILYKDFAGCAFRHSLLFTGLFLQPLLVYLGVNMSNICEKKELFQLQFASFFKFMAAYLSLTHLVTATKPLLCV